jgi:hypothetical protein
MGLGNSSTPRPAQASAPQQNQSHSGTRKMLGKRDIDALSYRDAEPWIRKIGKKPRRTVTDCKEQLHKYFQGKLDDHNIIL